MKNLITRSLLIITLLLSHYALAGNAVTHEGVLLDNVSNTVKPINTVKDALNHHGWEILSSDEYQVSAKRFHKAQQSELTLSLVNHTITYSCKCYKTKLVRQSGRRVELLLESFPKKAIGKLKKYARNNLVYRETADRQIVVKAPPKKSSTGQKANQRTAKDRLRDLKEWYEEELITEDEYKQKKQEILKAL